MQERFKQLLKEKKMTAAQFATLIKVNASAMSHILNGRSKPGFDVLDKIGQAFPDLNLNWLICGKGACYTSTVITESTNDSIPLFNEDTYQNINKEEETFTHKQKEEIHVPPMLMESPKQIKRIILFFDDGSFESYDK